MEDLDKLDLVMDDVQHDHAVARPQRDATMPVTVGALRRGSRIEALAEFVRAGTPLREAQEGHRCGKPILALRMEQVDELADELWKEVSDSWGP
ncbi:hypothetical protein [Spirillospora sp. NBC_01491]|uniref:hypothetical protein n=1 Tax=Spirillospora sp. NBC_01491 TaxID=2976007 RepID=UPI002E375CB7|nr:hypothetical protein [Spirillospora sp. NBC_01491]